MPGPAPKPTALKALAGNPGKRELNRNEPKPERVIPAVPRGLPVGARKFWRAHADALGEMGVLTAVDGPAFALMAVHYDIAWQAARTIQDEGLMTVDENGASRKHPLLQVLRDNSGSFLRYASQFGLTPAMRSKVSVPEAPNVDDYEAFLRG